MTTLAFRENGLTVRMHEYISRYFKERYSHFIIPEQYSERYYTISNITDDELTLLLLSNIIKKSNSKFFDYRILVTAEEFFSTINPTWAITKNNYGMFDIDGDTFGIFSYNRTIVPYKKVSNGDWITVRKKSTEGALQLYHILRMIKERHGVELKTRETPYYTKIYGDGVEKLLDNPVEITAIFL